MFVVMLLKLQAFAFNLFVYTSFFRLDLRSSRANIPNHLTGFSDVVLRVAFNACVWRWCFGKMLFIKLAKTSITQSRRLHHWHYSFRWAKSNIWLFPSILFDNYISRGGMSRRLCHQSLLLLKSLDRKRRQQCWRRERRNKGKNIFLKSWEHTTQLKERQLNVWSRKCFIMLWVFEHFWFLS